MKTKMLFILFTIASTISNGQNSLENLSWDVTPVFMRNMNGVVIDTTEIELYSIFHGDTSMVIVFDYNDIMEGNDWFTKCNNSLDSIVKNSRFSQIILESEFGKLIPLSDNFYSPTYTGYRGRRLRGLKSEYNFDVFPVEAHNARTFTHYISIPTYALKICQNNQKVRLHYLYRTTKKYSAWSNKDYIITSNWFSINEIH